MGRTRAELGAAAFEHYALKGWAVRLDAEPIKA